MKSNNSILFFSVIIFFSFLVPLRANEETKPAVSPYDVIDRLTQGNTRFVNGDMEHPSQNSQRRSETLSKGQSPVVTVLGCSDSREPVELIFDQGIGDIFVIRVAGNVADTDEIGSAEYGTEHLGTPLLVVLGHTECGAVTAVTKGDAVHGSIPLLVDNIGPAVEKAKKKLGAAYTPELLDLAVRNNVWQSVEDLITKSPVIRKLVQEKKLKIVGGVYHLDSGKVEWLGEHPDAAALMQTSAVPVTKKFASLTAGIIALFLVSYFLFISRSRAFKTIAVRGRMIAGYTSFAGAVIISIVAAVKLNGGSLVNANHQLMIYAAVAVAMTLIFAIIYANAITSSFKAVVRKLKEDMQNKNK